MIYFPKLARIFFQPACRRQVRDSESHYNFTISPKSGLYKTWFLVGGNLPAGIVFRVRRIIFARYKMNHVMKVYFLSLSFILAFIAPAVAADVNVDASGAVAGSYATINAGIAAASDGDRIVIFGNGLVYHENVTVNKSLTLMAASAEEYFFIEGDVTVDPAVGREVTIVGLSLEGNIVSAGDNAIGTRCTVNIVDSKVLGGIRFPNGGFDVNVLYCEVYYDVQLTHGKVIANTIGLSDYDYYIWGEIDVVTESASYGGIGDTIYIIANKVTKGDQSTSYVPVNFDNPNARYFIANNAIRNTLSSSSANRYTLTGVDIVSCYMVDSANVFINNFLMGYMSGGSCNSSATYAQAELIGIKEDNIINNLFRNRYGSGSYNYGCALLGQRGNYNVYSGFSDYPSGLDNNITYADNITIDIETGKITAGSGIDQGKPGAPYMDLDLTTNDVGTYGGPYSWENYWENTNGATGRARVYLLDIPANIYSITTPTTIKASSTHMK